MQSLIRKSRSGRWRNLLYGAQLLNESLLSAENPRQTVDLALVYLGSLQELFPKEIEPMDDFEGYTVREFAKALQQVLTRVRDYESPRHISAGH